ncbi:MAG: hypothetical protein HDR26_01930 [Lachnospiraceae bacterium]|nr:hypothetical protein [Lachnospiraceae bacterium]
MSRKTASWITILLAAGILLGLTAADMAAADRRFSQTENRVLASRPEFGLKELFAGEFTADYETYVTDQFVGRDQWIGLKTRTDMWLGKKDVGGVYLAKDGGLIERHSASDIGEDRIEQTLKQLQSLTEHCLDTAGIGQVKVMLVPTADNIQTDKLPDYADYFDQQPFLQRVSAAVGMQCYVDVFSVMRRHADEYIYYRTDHHWTTQGAYYAYEAWAADMGLEAAAFSEESRVQVTEEFLGTLHSRVNIPVKPDIIEAYQPGGQVQVYYDLSDKARDSLYEEKYLETKNKYGYFLDDNHGFVQIETGVKNGRTLFVIKDSYANCFIPFAAQHYETVCIVDLRYCNISLYGLIDQQLQEENGDMDVLILYNVIHFLEDFRFF